MKVVAFLQNQWVRNPETVRSLYARYPDKRESLNKRLLFAGSLTGKRLKAAFGEVACDSFVWEECSREIGGQSAANFPADLDHIRAVIDKHQPDIVLAFGANARAALPKVWKGELVEFPHPANRRLTPNDLKAWKWDLLNAQKRFYAPRVEKVVTRAKEVNLPYLVMFSGNDYRFKASLNELPSNWVTIDFIDSVWMDAIVEDSLVAGARFPELRLESL